MIELELNDKVYQLKLTTKKIIELEEKLGKNPLSIFMGLEDGKLPKIKDIYTIFECCIEADNKEDLFDLLVEKYGLIGIIQDVIIKVFIDSGYLQSPNEKTRKKITR